MNYKYMTSSSNIYYYNSTMGKLLEYPSQQVKIFKELKSNVVSYGCLDGLVNSVEFPRIGFTFGPNESLGMFNLNLGRDKCLL